MLKFGIFDCLIFSFSQKDRGLVGLKLGCLCVKWAIAGDF